MFSLDSWRTLQNHNQDNIVAIDFDGVINKNRKGFHDGTIYDEPIEGAIESIQEISKKYEIIIYTFKGHPDRPLVNGKTGIELVWDWLSEVGISHCIKDVVWGKPNAFIYVDDKGYRFHNWNDTIKDIDGYFTKHK